MPIALLDGDIFAYRVGHTTNNETFDIAKWRIDDMISATLEEVQADSYELYLTDPEDNFRRSLSVFYKANRTQPKPVWLEDLKEHLIVKWKAQFAVGQEADDALGIAQSQYEDSSVICSIDKDLKQIPGHHYNFVKKEWSFIDKFVGLYNFYIQLLVGDVADNVQGVQGIGPVKASRALEKCKTEYEMFEVVRKLYNDDTRLLLTGQLLKIRTYEGELWQFPNKLEQSGEPTYSSTIGTEGEISQSTGPTGQDESGSFPRGPEKAENSSISSIT